MKPIIKQEDSVIAVNYGDLMGFIADNCGIDDEDDAWEFAEKLTNGIMCEETVRFFSVDDIKNSDLYEKRGFGEEKEWLLKFFDAHPFITKMVVYFND